jgi:hypothetical protein
MHRAGIFARCLPEIYICLIHCTGIPMYYTKIINLRYLIDQPILFYSSFPVKKTEKGS